MKDRAELNRVPAGGPARAVAPDGAGGCASVLMAAGDGLEWVDIGALDSLD
jgi:hypothetical protein